MKNRYLLRRFFAYYIDGIVNFIILAVLLHVCNISVEHVSYILPIFIALFFCYYIFFDFVFGKTLGKKIMKLQISGFEVNSKIKLLKQVIIRNLFRWIPFDQISIFFYEDNKMWHDIVSKTIVSDSK